MFLNGTWRCIEIDDFFPVGKNGKPLCAYSSKGQLWIPILEKAYLKSQGGYNFPGSNSDIDIYTFTSWMPERLDFKKDDTNKIWKRLLSGMSYHNCMATISTGDLKNEDALGLCGGHAYGVLRSVECDGERMLMIKNPWGKYVWKGKYSKPNSLWTPNLRKACNYEETSKLEGIFWIDYQSVIENFEAITYNWNPELLRFKKQCIGLWEAKEFPEDDESDATNTPQYLVRFNQESSQSNDIICWVIFSVLEKQTDVDDGFHAIHVFLQNNCNQMPMLSKPFIKGVYSNRKCTLTYISLSMNELLATGNIIKLMVSETMKKSDLPYMLVFNQNRILFHTWLRYD